MRLSRLIAVFAAVILLGQGCLKPATDKTPSPAPVPEVLAPPDLTPQYATSTVKLTSRAFKHGKPIPSKYTCDGPNLSPPLAISDAPSSTKSLVLIVEDPDVPAYAGVKAWDHWVAFNLPPDLKKIDEGKQPPGVRGKGTGGGLMYTGPCPPDREHRYIFKLYALDILLDVPQGATREDVERAMSGHVIEMTGLMGTYRGKAVKK